MKRILAICLLTILAVVAAEAQVRSAQIGAGATWAFDLKPTVNRVSGYSSFAGIGIRLSESLLLTFNTGYDHLTVQQDSALEKWNWRFWESRYRGNISFTLNSADSANIDVRFSPLQTLGVLPVVVGVAFELNPLEDLFIVPRAGIGIAFYTRKLYLEEAWSRYFASVDYTYEYDYLNFADPKVGNPVMTQLGLDASYAVSDILVVTLHLRHAYILEGPGGTGHENLPFRQSFTGLLMLEFPY